jgi:hypothetical protein
MKPSTLQDRAMLTVLTISQWTNRKHDKNVSNEVEKAHAAKDAGRYNKQLIDKAALEPLSKIASAARDYHYTVTLPWGNNGERLLPAALFLDYAEHMRNFKAEFETRTRAFVQIYPALVNDARARLGTLYNALDYPAASEIASKFSIETSFTPVPSAGDFRVDLNEEYVDKIKSEITIAVETRQRDAVKHCWTRVKDVVGKIHERLANEEHTFRDSLIENARELVAILPALNITGDPELISIEADVKTLLVEPDVLRNNVVTRSETAKKAEAIMAKMAAFA